MSSKQSSGPTSGPGFGKPTKMRPNTQPKAVPSTMGNGTSGQPQPTGMRGKQGH